MSSKTVGKDGNMTRTRGGRVFAGLGLLAVLAGPAKADPPEPAVVTASREGFSIESGDGGFRLRITGYAQGDARIYAGDDNEDGVDTFVLRRVRPTLTGTVGRYFDFTIMPDFG